MKDYAQSKRDLAASNEQQIADLHRQIAELDEQIEHIAKLEEALEKSPYWKLIVDESVKRMKQLAQDRMLRDFDDPGNISNAVWHAEQLGRWKERLMVTQEYVSLLATKKQKVELRRSLSERIRSLFRKAEKRS